MFSIKWLFLFSFNFQNLDPFKVHPNGRIGEAREVASCISFLLSPAASMVTGVNVPVDGGLTSAVMWQNWIYFIYFHDELSEFISPIRFLLFIQVNL